MKDLLLSPHFKLTEFEHSATATSTGSTSPAARISARTATRLSTSCRRSNFLLPLTSFETAIHLKFSNLLAQVFGRGDILCFDHPKCIAFAG